MFITSTSSSQLMFGPSTQFDGGMGTNQFIAFFFEGGGLRRSNHFRRLAAIGFILSRCDGIPHIFDIGNGRFLVITVVVVIIGITKVVIVFRIIVVIVHVIILC